MPESIDDRQSKCKKNFAGIGIFFENSALFFRFFFLLSREITALQIGLIDLKEEIKTLCQQDKELARKKAKNNAAIERLQSALAKSLERTPARPSKIPSRQNGCRRQIGRLPIRST